MREYRAQESLAAAIRATRPAPAMQVEAFLDDPTTQELARAFGYADVREYAKAFHGFKGDGMDDMRLSLVRIKDSQARTAAFLAERPIPRAVVLANAQEVNERYGLGVDPGKLIPGGVG